jgi:hypothetical protein
LRSPWCEPWGKKDAKFAPSFGSGKAGAKASRAFNHASTLKDLGFAKARAAHAEKLAARPERTASGSNLWR